MSSGSEKSSSESSSSGEIGQETTHNISQHDSEINKIKVESSVIDET